MERDDIVEYLNKLQQLEKKLSGEDNTDLDYIEEINTVLSKLNNDVINSSLTDINKLNVKIKKTHPNAVIPTYSKPGDAGLDLTATEIILNTTNQITYGTGISLEIPNGYVGLVFPRSSIKKYELQLSNSVGVIDSGYRGEIQATFNKIHNKITDYNIGDRIAQLLIIPYPNINFVEVNELSSSERGVGGFGSTGT